MADLCKCGSRIVTPEQRLLCVRCGDLCCVACAFSLDSFSYCRRCGEATLEAGGELIDLRWWEPGQGPTATAGELRTREGSPRPWLIVVARDQPDLFAHLLRAFARDSKVEVLLDRRTDFSRNPPTMVDRLRTHGAALVRRPR